MLEEKRTDPLRILLFHGVDEPPILGGRGCGNDHEEEHGGRPDDRRSSAPV
jgi:hypothetical protein